LKIDGYIQRGVLQALNPLSNRVTFTAIVPEAYPWESKMWLKTLTLTSTVDKKDGYRQQNVRQRQKLISIIDYDV